MAARIYADDFKSKVLDSEIPVLVDFYSDSCVACKKLAPVLCELEEDYEGKLNIYKVNTNYEESTIADELVVDTNNFASKHTTVDASTILTAKYCKGIVCIQSQVYTAEGFTAGAWKKIGSISKYLPKEKISFPAVTYNSTGICYGRLTMTGDIEICPMVALSGSTPVGQVFFNFSYVV